MKRIAISMLLASLMALMTGCGRCYQGLCLPTAGSEPLLRDLMAGDATSQLKQTTPSPKREEIRFQVAGKQYLADLYTPGQSPGQSQAEPGQAALLLLPGTTTDGKNDTRMVDFARSLARSRFNVLVPDLENLKALRITPDEVGQIADVFEYLAARDDLAPHRRAGIAAVSYIVGPALLAAAEPRIRDNVKFVFGLGGYYDLEQVLTFVTTGQYLDEQRQWQYRQPNAHGKWVLVLSNLDRLDDPSDRSTLADIARIKINDPEAPIGDLSDKLKSQQGKALIALMNNRDRTQVPGLIAQLPASVRADLDALNLRKRDLSGLRARVHLLHGYDDSLIPFTESIALERALKSEKSLFLVKGLDHVAFSSEPDWFDALSLACVATKLLDERWR
ncbi:MAG: alpha/beta hydrolase [Candidatus Melainabacteria bacterium HGW-Melainabacteria-1]|nr:MAG: alpha/beta hydrolase [Candidatus Melainabacteria bacterium HGW-Melainabacteria-1]